MRYGRAGDVFIWWLDDMSTRGEFHLSRNEAIKQRDALNLFLLETEPPMVPPDEPALITGDA